MPSINEQEKNIQQLNQLVIIRQISREINSTVGLDQCLKLILDKTADLLGVEMASLMLIDKNRNELTIKYARGLNEKIVKEARAILDQKDPMEVAVWVVQRGEPLLIQDIERDGRFVKRDGKKYTTNSLLSVPLKARDEIIGVLNVNNKKDRGIFTQEDLDILMTLANEVSIAIQNNRLYEELMIANEQLKQLDQLKSDFIANVSHELSTPLATSKYLISVIEKGATGGITAKQKEYLILVHNNIDRLTRLIENLLDISRIEAGRFELKREPLDLTGIIKEAVYSFKIQARSKSIALKTALSNGLPNAYGDRDKIIQVMVNLMDNAIKFNREGGKVTISARIHEKSPFLSDPGLEFVEVCVADTGLGIANEDINKLFTKFHRVPQKQEGPKIKGTGLGLAITKEIIERHRGKIWVESGPGMGSRFFFTLPAYNERFFFREYLSQQIQKASDSKTSVSLLAFGLGGTKGLRQETPKGQIDFVMDEMYKITKKSVFRPSDIVRKSAGENKILIIAEADKAGAAVLKDRIAMGIKLRKIKDGKGRRINFTIKAAALTFPDDGTTAEELLDKLSAALEAK